MWYLCPGLLPPPAPHLHSRSCSELEASEGEDDVQERGHGKSSNSQAAAAALFVLKTNIRAATIAHFVAVPSAQCCRLRWQNRATGADSGFLTPRAAAAAGEPSSEAPKSTSWKITWPHFFSLLSHLPLPGSPQFWPHSLVLAGGSVYEQPALDGRHLKSRVADIPGARRVTSAQLPSAAHKSH